MRLSTRTLIRLCRAGQVFCLLMSLSGFVLIFASASPAFAQGGCQSVCMGENADMGACTWCERIEHGVGAGGMAAGSLLVLGGLGGAMTLGDLCHGLEQGGAGAPGNGGGQRREDGTPIGDAAALTSLIAGLGLTNADGTPVDSESLSTRISQLLQSGGERAPPGAEEGSGAEGETFRGLSPEGGPPQAPATEEARNRWQLLGADADGRIYDSNRQHILNIDANGNVTDLRGRPVSHIERDPGYGTINHYVDADGNRITSTRNLGLVDMDTYKPVEGPKPTGPGQLSGEVAARWTAVGAGPNGEMRAPDGSVIGQIGTDGTMTTHDGRAISGTSFQEGGRLGWFNTADGQHWAWDEASGQYRSSDLPDGQPFRPLSEAEWNRIDAQRAPTRAEADHPLKPGPLGAGTAIEGEPGARHLSPEEAARAHAQTYVPPGQPPAAQEGAEGPRGAEGAEDGSKTAIRGAGEGEARAEGEGTRAQDTGARPASAEGEAPAVRPSAEPTPAGAGEGPRATAGEGDARAAAGDDATRAAAVPEGETRAAADQETGGGGLASSAFSRVMDAQSVEHLYNQHIKEGMSPGEAFSLAVAQTGAGNIASDLAPIPGVTNPLSGAALSSLLPGGMSNVMPDQAVQNWVGTGYEALSALGESIGTSAGTGELDTSAFDRFAESVANRPNADPFAGYAQAAQLIGEESARTDGGNLLGDLQQIYETGAGVDVANEAMTGFQQQVEQGAFGAPLQGLNDLASVASDVIVDPTTTIGQFVDDVKNIYNYGVGDGFWNEAVDNTANVIKNTPVAGTIYDGYHQVFQGIADQGVGNFASEMAEGASALGGEAYDAAANAVTNAAGSVYDYVRSWF
jgi:hypothetical protein